MLARLGPLDLKIRRQLQADGRLPVPPAIEALRRERAAHNAELRDKRWRSLLDALVRGPVRPEDFRHISPNPMPAAKRIAQEVAHRHGMSFEEMTGASKHKEYVQARQEAMYLIYQDCPKMSLHRIGRLLGRQDHTSVINGVHRHAERTGLRIPSRYNRGEAGA